MLYISNALIYNSKYKHNYYQIDILHVQNMSTRPVPIWDKKRRSMWLISCIIESYTKISRNFIEVDANALYF